MSSTTFPSIPLDTEKAARAVFGRSNYYLVIGDRTDTLFDGLILNDPLNGMHKPVRTMAMFYLITIFQFMETLPDHLAADALRERIDWKYALHLPLNYPGLKADSLCEFRRRLLAEQVGQHNLQALLLRLSEVMDATSKPLTGLDSSQVILGVCQFSRLAQIWEVINQAMEALATRRPDWLLMAGLPHWYERYGNHRKGLNLTADSLEKDSLAQSIGADGKYLLEAVAKACNPELSELSEVRALRQVWREQFEWVESKLVWRKEVCAGCSAPDLWSYPIHNINGDQQEVEQK